MKNKTLSIAGIILIIIIIGLFYITNHKEKVLSEFKCPEEYGSPEEYINGTAAWAREYVDSHPGVSQEEILTERQRLFDQKKCKGLGVTS